MERTKFGYKLITSSRYIDQSLNDMDTERCNPVSSPGLQVTEKDLATEEQLPAVLAGLYRRVTCRLFHVAGHRPDAQQAVKELANVHWARLKRAMRYLVNESASGRLNRQPAKLETMCSQPRATVIGEVA